MKRYESSKLQDVMLNKLLKCGVPKEVALPCAENLVENSLDGIYSHGVNRFPRLISYLEKGYVKPQNMPTLVSSMGALQQWDGKLGMGNTNAIFCMDKAIELAQLHGIGCIALKNTNHWMRGGSYGMQAAKAGCVGICWTNTQPNMPAWGAKDRHIGNNPLIISVPYQDSFVMIDAAMSQFSYGAIEAAKIAGHSLSVPGGFDEAGNISTNPAEIEKTWRVLPIGYWKGSGFSVLLDMAAAALSSGNSTAAVGRLSTDEYSLSQIFIAINLAGINAESDLVVEDIISDIKSSCPVDESTEILYPSEKEKNTRLENERLGIPVDDEVWSSIMAL